MNTSPWRISDRYDPAAVALADRHYNRQKPGTPQFIPPGTYLALISQDRTAVWVTSWPDYRMDKWRGAWINSLFRKEGPGLASEMIRCAVAHTRARWPVIPALGMVTFVNPDEVRSTNPGCCYRKAGFRHVATTPKGLLVFQLLAKEMPPPRSGRGHAADPAGRCRVTPLMLPPPSRRSPGRGGAAVSLAAGASCVVLAAGDSGGASRAARQGGRVANRGTPAGNGVPARPRRRGPWPRRSAWCLYLAPGPRPGPGWRGHGSASAARPHRSSCTRGALPGLRACRSALPHDATPRGHVSSMAYHHGVALPRVHVYCVAHIQT